jgi:hypothetical protein
LGGYTCVETIELVREGKTANVTRNTPPIAQGNMPILFNISRGFSIVVRSLSISTLASAGILTADSFGVILLRYRNTTSVAPVNPAEQAKKIAAAILVLDALVSEIIDATGGKIPLSPWPVISAWVYRGPNRPARPKEAYWVRAVAEEPIRTEKSVKMK